MDRPMDKIIHGTRPRMRLRSASAGCRDPAPKHFAPTHSVVSGGTPRYVQFSSYQSFISVLTTFAV